MAGPPNFAVVLRVRQGDPAALVSTLRAAVAAIDKDQPVMDAEPVDRFIARFVSAGPKFNVVLFGVFGAMGLALVTVGIYGVIANSVARRQREIGIRMALGATMQDVVRLAGGLATARYLAGMLRGNTPYDPISTVAVVLLLAFTGLLASWLPARRAAKVPPVDALRAE